MTITSKTGEQLNFLETGIEGIYILDRAIFADSFDRYGCNDYEKSSGKKLLEQWFKEYVPVEIQEQFDVDLPVIEEVFSQKMLNLYELGMELKSKQFPIFKDSDERIKGFEGRPTWWWTRSVSAHHSCVWCVDYYGSMDHDYANYVYGFVPVLRRKRK